MVFDVADDTAHRHFGAVRLVSRDADEVGVG